MKRTYGRKVWESERPIPAGEKPVLSAAGHASKLANRPAGLPGNCVSEEQARRYRERKRARYRRSKRESWTFDQWFKAQFGRLPMPCNQLAKLREKVDQHKKLPRSVYGKSKGLDTHGR